MSIPSKSKVRQYFNVNISLNQKQQEDLKNQVKQHNLKYIGSKALTSSGKGHNSNDSEISKLNEIKLQSRIFDESQRQVCNVQEKVTWQEDKQLFPSFNKKRAKNILKGKEATSQEGREKKKSQREEIDIYKSAHNLQLNILKELSAGEPPQPNKRTVF